MSKLARKSQEIGIAERLLLGSISLLNICLLMVLIIIASYATMELAARISAKSFIGQRINEINQQLGSIAGNNSEPALVQEYRSRQSQIKQLNEELTALEFAGARTSQSTVHAIQSKYEGISTNRQERSRIASTTEEIQLLSLDVNSLSRTINRFQSDDNMFELSQLASRRQPNEFLEIYFKNASFREYVLNLRNYTIEDLRSIESSSINLPKEPNWASLNNIEIYISSVGGPDTKEIPASLRRELGEFFQELKNYMTFLSSDTNPAISRLNTQIDFLNQQLDRDQNVFQISLDQPIPSWVNFFPFVYLISQFPSDIVLAIIVISCGAVGSLFAGLRANDSYALGRAPMGAVAGFFSFCIIKGGKFLFIIQAAEVVSPINPYACAFTGLITGLFTERAYKLLERLVDQGIEKLGSQNDEPEKTAERTAKDDKNLHSPPKVESTKIANSSAPKAPSKRIAKKEPAPQGAPIADVTKK